MRRRVTLLTAAVGLLLSGGCCWNRCGGGWFACRHREPAPCYLTGRGAEPGYDAGVPLTGPPPGGLVPGVGPGPVPGGPPDVLPYPQPSNQIPSPNVPLAPPSVAPDPGLIGGVRSGQPIRTGR
jgi:hypothetical protein